VKFHALTIKSTGLVLSGVLLATQSLFGYQPEKSFWDQRRQAARRTSPGVLASLPIGHRGGETLAAQFPSPQLVRSSLTPSVARSLPKPFLKNHADLLTALSPAHGSVRKVSLGKNAGSQGPVVIHIQDVHMNAEAQKNIRETVVALLKSGQVGLVALEGSTEDIALQPFVDFPNRKAVELTADYLLKENKISGPIHAAMTAQGKLPRVLGIDDPVHYAANVQAYKDSAPKLEETRLAINKWRGELEEQKKAVFSPALLALDQTVTGYRNDKVSLGDYVEALVGSCSVVAPFMGRPLPNGDVIGSGNSPDKSGNYKNRNIFGRFPVLNLFLQALKTERALDFKQVESERSRLIEKLTNSLNTQEINALMAQSLAYRTGELRYGDFYAQLRETCRKKGIRLSDYPAMDEYVRYVLLCDGIDAEQLLNEIAALEKAAYDTLAATPEEKALAAQSRQAWLTSKLVDFSLTPPEWREYGAAKGNLEDFPSPLGRGEGEGLMLSTQEPPLASFRSFYQEAESRDTAMAKNLLAALELQSKSYSASPPIALLITGGFHAEGMADLLTKAGATVISHVPKIEKIDAKQGSKYLSVFTQEKSPLEKLFQGEKLFLSPDMASAATKIGPPIVAGISSTVNTEINLLVEKTEAMRKFLDETMGPRVGVQVREIGKDLVKGTVKVSVKIGTKELIIEIKTGTRFEIISVNGQKPKAPSRLIGAYMEMVSRLNTWFRPLASRVVKFTESPILWSLPFWRPAQIAWWLTHHLADISSVSDVVWQLSFLEGISSKMKGVRGSSNVPFLATSRFFLGPKDTHSMFNLVSPSKATVSRNGTSPLPANKPLSKVREAVTNAIHGAYLTLKKGESQRFVINDLVDLKQGRLITTFPTPAGTTEEEISFGGGGNLNSVEVEIGRDEEGLYWTFISAKKDGRSVTSILRWSELTQDMMKEGSPLQAEMRSAYRKIKPGEKRVIGNVRYCQMLWVGI
jgi:hypothetical protein